MDEGIKAFLDNLIGKAAEDIRSMQRTPENVETTRREVELITLNAQVAIAKLENGQRQAYQNLRHERYAGVLD